MNDFGFDLKGKHGIMKAGIFFEPKADAKAREFLILGGLGCDPTPNTPRKVTGRWVADNMPDTLNSYDFEYVLVDGKKIFQKVTGDPPPERPVPVAEPEESKPVRRKRT